MLLHMWREKKNFKFHVYLGKLSIKPWKDTNGQLQHTF
jgi:hypothetical protein